jgi:hypothetical protein
MSTGRRRTLLFFLSFNLAMFSSYINTHSWPPLVLVAALLTETTFTENHRLLDANACKQHLAWFAQDGRKTLGPSVREPSLG